MADQFIMFMKLMEMTTSDHDNEALTALRKANAKLAEQNMTWTELLTAKVKFTRESAAPNGEEKKRTGRHYAPDDEIEKMFETLLNHLDEENTFRDFVEDVYGFWERTGFITDKQYDAIARAAGRV